MVDKNCWTEVLDDTKYDANDPHVKGEGPKEHASLKNLSGRGWINDIQSVIMGSGATVLAYYYKDNHLRVQGSPSLRASTFPDLSQLDMSNHIESMKITCGK